MYKVLIVDDENLVRVALRTIVDYESCGFTVCATAADGLEALEICRKEDPDLIITDIKMPRMDGISMIEALRQEGFSGQIILISNYDDFELVRQGLVMGAMDYLLKLTLSPQDFSTLLARVKKVLDETARRQRQVEQGKQAMNKLANQEKLSLWRKLLSSPTLVQADIPEELFASGPKSLFLIRMVKYGPAMSVASQKDIELVDYAVSNITAEVLGGSVCIGSLESGDWFVVLEAGDRDPAEFLARKLCTALTKYLNITVLVLYSTRLCAPSQLLEAMEHRKLLPEHMFYCRDSKSESLEQNMVFGTWNSNLPELAGRLCALLRRADVAAAKDVVREQMAECQKKNVRKNEVIVKWSAVILRLCEKMEGFLQADVLANGGESRLTQARTAEQLEQMVMDLLEQMASLLQPVHPELPGAQEVAKVLAYIQEHLAEKITLAQLAHIVNFNETYLCTIFRSHMGTSIFNYINQTKVECAAEKLKNSDMQLKEIAASLGFSDQFYFNKMFRKYYGISPSEYRKTQDPTNFR